MTWFGLTLPVVLGTTGLGVDATLWYMDRRILQTASDSGAIAGAHALTLGASKSEVQQVVADEIARNDFDVGPDDVITVNIPPANGPNTGIAGLVEVIIDKHRDGYFARFFLSGGTAIQARAVGGGGGSGVGEHCVLALHKSADGAVNFSGTADTDINCGVATNSRSDSAIELDGGAAVNVDYIEAHGDITVSNNATLSSEVPPKPYSNYVGDPYAALDIPPASVCDYEPATVIEGGTFPLEPGRYCGGLQITSGAEIFLNPGVYVIDGGDLIVNGNATISGDDVTFILTADDPADIGNVWFAGGTTANLNAPSDADNPYAGVLIYQDRQAPSFTLVKEKGQWVEKPIPNKILGGAQMDLNGAIYIPSRHVQFTGGGDSADGCMVLISNTVDISGNSNILNSEQACADYRVKQITQSRVSLLE